MAVAGEKWRDAYVLCLDVVDSALLPAHLQETVGETLRKLCVSSETWRQAPSGERLSGWTGDGFVVAFYLDVTAPLKLALELDEAVKHWNSQAPQDQKFAVRIGLASGLAAEARDLEGNLNVRGDGVNLAARVADVGEANHILLSKDLAAKVAVAAPHLAQNLQPLGTYQVKRTIVEVVNYFDPEAEHGRADRPTRHPMVGPVTVPQHDVPFVGRETEVEEVLSRLTRERVLALRGEAGVGKTAVAIEVGRRAAQSGDYPGGVLWVSLEAGGSVESVCGELLSELLGEGALPSDPEARRGALERHLRQSPTLLIFDNFETVAKQRDVVEWVLRLPEPTRILMTSREHVGRAPHVILEELSLDAAAALFVERARSQGWTAREDKELINALCAEVGCSPLVIVLLAPRAARLPLAELLEQVRSNISSIADDDNPLLPARQRSVEACLRLSYDRLTPPAQTVFRRASVFAESASLRLIRETCNVDNAIAAIEELVNASMLRFDGSRYRYHRLIKLFAGELLRRQDDVAEARRRALDSLTRVCVEAHQMFSAGRQMEAVRLIEPEADNALAAVEDTLERADWEFHRDLTRAIDFFMNLRGLLQDHVRITSRAARLAGQMGDRPHQAWSAYAAGVALRTLGRSAEAERMYDQSLAIYREIGHRHGEAATLFGLGILAWQRGALDEAERLCGESLEIDREIDNRLGEATTLHLLATLAGLRGDVQEARRLHLEGLTIKREIGDRRGEAATLNSLGMLARDEGETAEAQRLYREALEIDRAIGDRQGQAAVLHELGELASRLNRPESAVRCIAASVELLDSMGAKEAPEVRARLEAAKGELPDESFRHLVNEARRDPDRVIDAMLSSPTWEA